MMNKVFTVGILIGLFLLAVGCGSQAKQEEGKSPPNIIFLMDDQHRWDALGIVNPQVSTPTLDKLAGEGVFFKQAVCQAPMCVASRNSMMLGLYPNQVGILRNEPGIPDGQLPAIPLAQVFKDAGYETAGFGKTHWGVASSTRGFETRYCSEIPEEGAVLMINTDPDKKKAYDAETAEYGPGEEDPSGYIGRTSGIPEGSHRDGWITDRCMEYLADREDERPLFLYLSFMKPHAGHNVPRGYEDPYQLDQLDYAVQPSWHSDKSPHASGVNRRDLYVDFWKDASEQQWQEMTMRYYANCTWMDAMFGRVLDQLEEKGLLDNALIVYVSDHGEMLGERYYRFNKYCLYESSVRVPIILSGSALAEKWVGQVDERPAELVDIYPTLLQAAGIDVPSYVAGKDLLSSSDLRPANFCALHERADEAAFMWRTPSYKLILRMQRGSNAAAYTMEDVIGGEFYDLERDPWEWTDLYNNPGYKKEQSLMTLQLMDHLKILKKAKPL
jgi:arylsulfatase A-like enzyme